MRRYNKSIILILLIFILSISLVYADISDDKTIVSMNMDEGNFTITFDSEFWNLSPYNIKSLQIGDEVFEIEKGDVKKYLFNYRRIYFTKNEINNYAKSVDIYKQKIIITFTDDSISSVIPQSYDEYKDAGVVIYKFDKDKTSMANRAVNPISKYKENEDGSYTYKLQFKPITLGIITSGVDALSIDVGGVKTPLEYETIQSDYTQEYTFTMPERADTIIGYFMIKNAPGGEKKARIVFNYDGSEQEVITENTAYFLNKEETLFDPLNDNCMNTIDIITYNNVDYIAEIEVNDIESLYVDINGYKECVKNGNKFRFDIPVSMVTFDSEIDAKIPVKYGESEAVLLIDWNGDLNPEDYIDNGSGNDDEYPGAVFSNIRAELYQTDSDELSMAESSLNKIAKYTVYEGKHIYKVQFGKMTIGTETAGINTFTVVYPDGTERKVLPKDTGDATYHQEYIIELSEKVDALRVGFVSSGMTDKKYADLKFFYDVVDEDYPGAVFEDITAGLYQEGTDELSMAASSLNEVAKYTVYEDKHVYKVQFGKMTIGTETAGINTFTVVYPDGVERKVLPKDTGDDTYHQEYTIALSEKVDQLKVGFISSGMTDKKYADLKFFYDNSGNEEEEEDFSDVQFTSVDAKLLKAGTEEVSDLNASMILSEFGTKNGEYVYKIHLNRNDITAFSAKINSEMKVIKPHDIEGGVKEYIFAFPIKAEKIETLMQLGEEEKALDLSFTYQVEEPNDEPEVLTYTSIFAKLYEKDQDSLSMANDALNHTAQYGEKDGRHYYKVQFGPMNVGSITGTVSTFSVVYNGNEEIISAISISNGQYNKEYAFDLPAKVDRLRVGFYIEEMGKKPYADMVFSYSGVDDTPPAEEESVNAKAYILTSDKKNLSVFNYFLDSNITIDKKKPYHKLRMNISDITLSSTHKIESASIKMNGSFVNGVRSGNIFTFDMPREVLKESGQSEFKMKFTLNPTLDSYVNLSEEVLMIDWDNSYSIGNLNYKDKQLNSNSTWKENQLYKVPIALYNAYEDELSMANEVFKESTYALIKRVGSVYEIKATTNLITMMGVKSGLETIKSYDSDIIGNINGIKKTEEGITYIHAFSFKTNKLKEMYMVGVTANPMPDEKKARIKLDLSNPVAVSNIEGSENDLLITSETVPQGLFDSAASINIEGESVIKDKVAEIEISEKELNKAIEDINKQADKNQLYIKSDKPKVKELRFILDKRAIKKLASKAENSLKIEGLDASIILPNEVLKSIASKAGEKVAIIFKKYKKGIEIIVKINNEEIVINNEILVLIENYFYNEGDALAYIDKDGNKTIIKQSIVGKKRAIAKVLLNKEIILHDIYKHFKDVQSDDWFRGAVDFVISHGLFNGVSEKEFAPHDKMTRAMLVTVLYRINEEKVNKKNTFTDIKSDAYYNKAVSWAYENKIVTGYNGKFSPNKEITREDIAAILYRYMGSKEVNSSKNLERFSDAKEISTWAKKPMAWAVKNGLFKGYNNSLNPKGKASRAEVATLIKRIIAMKLK